jgi:hypothetical protein
LTTDLKFEFGSPVNPITTRGADYTDHITDSPPGFENPAASQKYGFCTEVILAKSIF